MPIELTGKAHVVPLVQSVSVSDAIKQAKALVAGGLEVIEVVLRTDEALECLEAIAQEAVVGAGTIISKQQAKQALERGAKFIVSPGLDEGVVNLCKDCNVPVFPGVVTPSDVMRAHNMGLRIVKFFPAGLAGGVPMLRSLSAVFRDMKFMPTGGISADNLKDYLSLPSVVACGGSWLTPKSAIEAGDYSVIEALAREALSIAQSINT